MISLFRLTEEMRGSANTVALAWSRAAWMKWSTLSLKVSLRWGRGEGEPGGEEAGQEGGHRDVRVEVDAQHGDHSSVVPQNGNGGGLEQGAVLIVEVHLGLGLLLLLQVPQQVQPKVGDGGAGLAVGVVPVDDLHHGVAQVLQTVEDDS